MKVREVTADDQAAIREIAKRSLQASYSLSPQTIESAVRQWYDPDEFEAKVTGDEVLIFVAEEGDEPVAFTENALLEEGEADVLWLHVHPDYRGQGIGSELFETTRSRLEDYGVTRLHGRVLAMNEAGNTFYRNQGFEKVSEGEVRIDDSPYTEAIYVEAEPTGLQPLTDDGKTVYVDHDDIERGSLASFHVVYTDQDRQERYGYHCAKCDTLANAMDSMGRIECGTCGNSRKPTRWDASYL
ncbi:GNAT family N-acetyltransferase [Halorientalis brevis]|uniref:GNAT family N-acetyltransferase n=1 Tax=Halorientalis brevis TaxID=1126241 RepID=A0ABD6CAB9_9EURY|nr:GNAT family N-acetyltransferase [Halorientalis brevis]